MADTNLTIGCKVEVVTLAEEVDSLLKPFNTVRTELVNNNTTTGEDGKPVVNQEGFKKDVVEAIAGELELSIEKFTLATSENDGFLTPQTIAIFKKFFGDAFLLDTK